MSTSLKELLASLQTSEIECDLQIQLDSIADPIVFQSKLVVERPLPLPFQHDLVRFSADLSGDLSFEKF